MIRKIIKDLGGIKFFILYFSINIVRRYQWLGDGYNFTSLTKADGLDPNEKLNNYLKWGLFWSITLQMNYHFKGWMTAKSKMLIGQDAHQNVLGKVMNAPINLFFDVTPIGTILKRFRDDMEVFRSEMLNTPSWLFDMTSHWVTVLVMYLVAGMYEGVVATILGFGLLYYFMSSKLAIDNMLHKTKSIVSAPFTSYIHESMRGITVIKAFD